MTLIVDQLRREEQLVTANLWARRLWPFGLALLMFLAGLFLGIRHRAPSQEDAKTVQALKDISDSLKIVRIANDSLKHSDSVATAAVLAERPRVDQASAMVHVSTNPVDSAITVQRPASVHDTVARPDTVILVPLEVASFIREAKIQLPADSVALHIKDLRIAELVHGDSLWQRSDSLHVEHETALQDEADSAFRRGAVKAVKVIVEVAVVAGVVIKLVRFIGK